MPKDRAVQLREVKKEMQKVDEHQLRRLTSTSNLFAVMYDLYSEEAKTVQISKAKPQDVSRILEVTFPVEMLYTGAADWKAPEIAEVYKLSATFVKVLEMLQKFITTTGEPLTRTWIDMYVLEALRHVDEAGTLKIYGEIAIKKKNMKTGEILSGEGDYLLGYAENVEDIEIKNLLVIGEAKSAKVGVNHGAVCQILAYMLIVHLARKAANKRNANVFGFLSSRDYWIFFRIDNSQKTWRSKTFQYPVDNNEILNFLTFIFKSAQVASATCSPFASQQDLQEASLYKSWENLAAFEPVHRGMEEEEMLGDPLGFELVHAEVDDTIEDESDDE